jgi:hypothetical protein
MNRLRTALPALAVRVGGLALAACAPGANDVPAAGAGQPAVVFGSGSRASAPARRSVRSSR